MRSEDSPRLMMLGSEAMMRPCEDAGEADRLCSEVRVLTGGSGPPLDTWDQRTTWSHWQQCVQLVNKVKDCDTCSHQLGIVGLEECVAGLQLVRADHQASHSFPSATSG